MSSLPPIQIRHDPFARGGYYRYAYNQSRNVCRSACRWCGQQPRTLYSYVWQSDARAVPREPDDDKLFCNFQCHFSYHD